MPDFRLDWLVWLESKRPIKHTQKGQIVKLETIRTGQYTRTISVQMP